MGDNKFIARLYETESFYFVFIFLYVLILMIQINQYPLERYPGWDQFWGDTLNAGTLISLKQALPDFELPYISPYTGFGWNLGGNHNSFWALPNILVLFFSPGMVIVIRQIIFLFLGALGTFLFLRLIIQNKFLCFLGGLTYISLPYVITLHYFYPISYIFYMIPCSLFLIHKILEHKTAKNLLAFAVFWAIAIGSCDIHCFFVFPVVVFLYTFLIGLFYYRLRFFVTLKKSLILLFLSILSGSFYIVPLLNNLRTISSSLAPLLRAQIYQAEQIPVNFLQFFFKNGIKSLFLPTEGSAITLYIPIFFYIAIIASLIFRKAVFKNNPKHIFVMLALVVLGITMLLESMIFYSPLMAKVFPAIAEGAKGILRSHLNLIPFMNLLAGFICLGSINCLKSRKQKICFYAFLFIGSLALDVLLFVKPRILRSPEGFFQMTSKNPYFESSNLLPISVLKDSWLYLPIINSLLLIFIFALSLAENFKSAFKKKFFAAVVTLSAIMLPLLNISIYNQLRLQQGNWQITTRNSYRWDNYMRRKACLNAFINDNLNYRILYAGEGLFQDTDGRDFRLIAETELHVSDRNKVLFSYREFEDPYTGLLRGTFRQRSGYQRSNIMPPLSSEVQHNIQTMKLMGIKYVVSAGKKIDYPDLIFKGECLSKEGPMHNLGYLEGGFLYFYELSNPLKIAFLADHYKKGEWTQILKMIYENKEHPWNNNLVYLETDPLEDLKKTDEINKAPQARECTAEIRKETHNSIELYVASPQDKFLVLSYNYRPNWKAFIDSSPAKIYRAYGGFMCIKIPQGMHQVKFKYHPTDVYSGLFLTFIAFLLPVGLRKKL